MLPECSASAASTIAQAILDDVRALRIPFPDARTLVAYCARLDEAGRAASAG